jgi:hypothetical protein
VAGSGGGGQRRQRRRGLSVCILLMTLKFGQGAEEEGRKQNIQLDNLTYVVNWYFYIGQRKLLEPPNIPLYKKSP